MKRLITILLLAISGFASAQYQLNYADIRIGNLSSKTSFRGNNLLMPYITLGTLTDSVLTIAGGRIYKVPRSQFSGGGSGAVSSVFGRTGDVVAQSSDYDPFYPLLTGNYNNPTWINTLAYSKITGVPAFITTETDPTVPAYAKSLTAFSDIKTSTDALYEPIITSGSAAQYIKGNKTLGTFQTDVSANADVAANTAVRHSAVTIGTANGLSLAGQVLSMGLSSSGVTGALSGSDWNTFNSKQNQLVLTTLGTSGTASLIGNTLNIPNYATGGGAGSSALRVPITLASNATLIQITWATYATDYGVRPTDLSLIELSATGDRQVFTNWYSDDNGVTYKFDVAPETGSRNFVVVISGGSTVTSGNVTSVTSANGDISVTNSTTTPVLTLNSGTGANQIVKRNGSGAIADLAPYLQSATAATTYEPIFSKNTAFNKNFGTVAGTVTEGNDGRVLNGQTAFGWGNHASAGYLTQTTGDARYLRLTGGTLTGDLFGTTSAFSTYSRVGASGTTHIDITSGDVKYYASNGSTLLSVYPLTLTTSRVQRYQDDDGTIALTKNYATGQTIGANTTGTAANATTWNGQSFIGASPSIAAIMTNQAGTSNWGFSTISQVKTALATTLQETTSAGNITNNSIIIDRATGAGSIGLRESGVSKWEIGTSVSDLYMYNPVTSSTNFTIKSTNGNVLIGSTTDNVAYKLQVTGGISATGNVGINGDISAANLASSNYTATTTTGTNISTAGSGANFYTRIGNIVTVSGNVTATNSATGQSSFTMSIPVPSNFTTTTDASGTAWAESSNGGYVYSNSGTQTVTVYIGNHTNNASKSFRFSFQYIIK